MDNELTVIAGYLLSCWRASFWGEGSNATYRAMTGFHTGFEVRGGGNWTPCFFEARITRGVWGHAPPDNFMISTFVGVADSADMPISCYRKYHLHCSL